MAKGKAQRRLAAILSADVVGYSRLVRTDEEGTISRLKSLRQELIDPKIDEFNGRIVKLMGDGVLAEFSSVVDAVRNAAAVQRAVAERNANLAEGERFEFRVGINLGDVVIDGEDIQGDGVNVAARIEKMSEPGGICISGSVYDQVRGRVDLQFEDLGLKQVKNIDEPVRVWRWVADGAKVATTGAAVGEASTASEKPSVAVLPFQNMSGDPEQEFFTDGISEDIITELSRFGDLLVIARNSTFVYKNRAVSIQEVAKEFGVEYVVEGSVRKAGDRVRVTAQLIDGETGRHIWAERYDRRLEDIFEIQDEITAAIVSTIPGRIEAATRARAERKTTANMVAYECLLTGKVLHHRSTRRDNEKAQEMLDKALALDPKYAHAHAWKACILGQSWVHGWCADRDETFNEVQDELKTALTLDQNDADVHRILAAANIAQGNHEQAAYHQERALSLNPNYDLVVVQQGELLTWLGEAGEGIEWITKAMRINPHHPERFWSHLGRAYYVAERYGEAVAAFRRLASPDHTHHAFLAASYAQMDDETAAKAQAVKVLRLAPEFTVTSFLETLHFKHAEDADRLAAGLKKAGLPA